MSVTALYYLTDPGEAMGCSTNSFVVHWFIQSVSQPFPPTALQRRHAQMVRDSSSSYKIDYVIVIKNFLNPEGHQNLINGSKVTAILLKRWILHIGGASAVEGLRSTRLPRLVCIVLYSIILYCIVLYCTVLCCSVGLFQLCSGSLPFELDGVNIADGCRVAQGLDLGWSLKLLYIFRVSFALFVRLLIPPFCISLSVAGDARWTIGEGCIINLHIHLNVQWPFYTQNL